ncbi:hypothetical protein HN385_02070 [archaeon]|jgi:hypothetical protein|nr:hypothetical protein [archaeon]MBT3450340.1 hypothetical protein [archaeon]MBT6868885.1 hypothetical protein [archaeon]MBT7192894.1 hypothetical protein [archaeon]MBT7380860.1 hypothetical protein [archaeon]
MKYIFAYVDKLMILLKFYPAKPKTDEDFKRIGILIVKIKIYTFLLRKLINSHEVKGSLKKLQESNSNNIEGWAVKVSSVFENLDNLLKILDEDNKKLSHAIEHEPQKLQSLISDLALGMILTGLHNEEEHLKELRKIAILEEHELKRVISNEHLNDLHQWHDINQFNENKKILEIEKFFMRLLS